MEVSLEAVVEVFLSVQRILYISLGLDHFYAEKLADKISWGHFKQTYVNSSKAALKI